MGSFWCGTDHLEWEVLGTWLQYSGWTTKISILNIRHKHFLTKPNYDISTAIENDNIWNWLKSCSEYYTISDSRSNYIWPEYCDQCLANKTDHLEWEVFDAGLTILNGKSLGLDYNILVGLLKYRFWISDTNIFWPNLIMIYPQPLKMTIFETDWRAVLNTIQFQILGLIVSGQNIVVSVLLIRLTISSGKFLMRGWPSWMGSPWDLITIFWLAY